MSSAVILSIVIGLSKLEIDEFVGQLCRPRREL